MGSFNGIDLAWDLVILTIETTIETFRSFLQRGTLNGAE